MNATPLCQARLYAFVDTAYLRGRAAAQVARELCAGGADLIQLRAKTAPLEEVQRLAEAILPITQAAGVPLVINDYPRLALAVGTPWCHLGQEDFYNAGYAHVSDLKRSLAPAPEGWHGSTLNSPAPMRHGRGSTLNFLEGLCLGLSTHAPEQAQRAIAAGADYIAIGPVYATGTKSMVPPVTLDYVRWAAAHARLPWFAIGGINLDNLEAVLGAGARRVGVVSAILNARDIAGTCQQFKRRLTSLAL